MDRRLSAATTLMAVVAALFALLLATVPAAAHHKAGHEGGGGKSSSQADDGKDNDGDADSDADTAYTEDDDTNDGNTPNNQADEGDNAHPSGKDKSVENGGSGNQGSSESDPDDDGRGPDRSNGGPDKPNGSGGVDKADQDGNNGCGNDDDFEDDNEGWCGKPVKPSTSGAVKPEGPCDADATMPGTQPCEDEEVDAQAVLGDVISRPAAAALEAPETVDEPEVLGERLARGRPGAGVAAERGASFLGQELPFTGSALVVVAAIAVGLLLVGAGLMALRPKA